MNLIFDTHALAWLGAGDRRFSRRVLEQMEIASTRLFLSAVTAWEYEDLSLRKRLPGSVPLQLVLQTSDFVVLPLPEAVWTLCRVLPDHHRDPMDRMLIAHALHEGHLLVTADSTMHRYPVPTLW